jgi:hypothetical protein
MKVMDQASRLVPYWVTVVVACWCIAFQYAWNSNNAYEKIQSGMVDPVRYAMVPATRTLYFPH